MWERMIRNWVQGGFLAGLMLLAITPALASAWPAWLTWTWPTLPIYMLHQLEEHDRDRFRSFVNTNVGGGHEVLSLTDVFLINVPGVWGVIGAALWLAVFVRPGLGLIATYVVLVNAAVHCAGWIALRRYNPGLVTALTLFTFVGIGSLMALQSAGATVMDHVIALAVAIVIHAAIILHIRLRLSRMTQDRGK